MKARKYVPESITGGTHSAVKTKALMLSLIAIATAFIIELAGGLLTNSLAVLTDSIHAAFDAVVTAMLIMMTKLAQKPRDIEHTYGHGRLETLGGFVGGIILFMIAIFFAYESLIRLVVSTPVVTPGIVGFFAVFYALAIAV
ncbi:MAG: cation diffusion facilitator family transporter, partial [Thaumarchaeota archaeon]|nr:cation diffusion facilitator family transporter [Nitrososphaerota archaeon]